MVHTLRSSPHGPWYNVGVIFCLMRDRFDAFPAQLVLTVLWATLGTAASLYFRSSLLWVSLISVYAIVISHWGAHLSWRAKRAAEQAEKTDDA